MTVHSDRLLFHVLLGLILMQTQDGWLNRDAGRCAAENH